MCLQQYGINSRGKVSIDQYKTFYLNNVLPEPEFMRIPLKIILQEIVDNYNLTVLIEY